MTATKNPNDKADSAGVYNHPPSLLLISISFFQSLVTLFPPCSHPPSLFLFISLSVSPCILPPLRTLSVTYPGSAPRSGWQFSLLSLSTAALQTNQALPTARVLAEIETMHAHTHNHTQKGTRTSIKLDREKERGSIFFLQWQERPSLWCTNCFVRLSDQK